MQKCILHIGAPKTGSTSIQIGFFRGKEHLKNNGFLYPGNELNHQFLYSLFHPDPKTTAYNLARGHQSANTITAFHKRAVVQLEKEIGSCDAQTLLFSHEDLSRLPQQSVLSLSKFLLERVKNIEVHCYVRHPLSAAVSWAQQMVKTGRWRLNELDQHKLYYDAQEYLPNYIEAFGRENIHVHPFEKTQLFQNDVALDLARQIGLKTDLVQQLNFARKNESLSIEGAILSDALTSQYPREVDGFWNQERALGFEITGIKGEKFGLPRELLAKITHESSDCLNYLSKEFQVELQAPKLERLESHPPSWGHSTSVSIAKKINDLTRTTKKQKSEISYLKARLLLEKKDGNKALQFLIQSLLHSQTNIQALQLATKLMLKQNRGKQALLLAEQYATLNGSDQRFMTLLNQISNRTKQAES